MTDQPIDPDRIGLLRKIWPTVRPASSRTHRGFLLRCASDPILAKVSTPMLSMLPPVVSG